MLPVHQSVALLIKTLDDDDNDVRREAVLALGSFQNNRAFSALVKTLSNTQEDHLVRAAAIASLSRFGHKQALASLLRVVRSRRDETKPEAIEALGAFQRDWVLKHLLRVVKHTHEDIQSRSRTIRVLSRLGGEQTVETLIHLIQG